MQMLKSKIMMIGGLIFAFLIVFMFIRGTIYERQANYQQVVKDIARNNVNPQTVMTPFIVVPVNKTRQCKQDPQKICTYQTQLLITPQQSQWDNQVKVDNNSFKRGIYRAMSYRNSLAIEGRFSINDTLLDADTTQSIDWSKATMRFYVSDLRGLSSQPMLTIAQQKKRFELPKQKQSHLLTLDYTQVALPNLEQMPIVDFKLEVDVSGMSALQMIPLGDNLTVSMMANWPHASFWGDSLPIKQLNSQSFSANWQNMYVSNRNTQLLDACLQSNREACTVLQKAFATQSTPKHDLAYAQQDQQTNTVGGFGVSFIQAVDVYLMSERSVKYAALFLVITFGAFFLFETLKGLAIHPIQYSLVGAALAVFYLLLLSFSEHIGFVAAYSIAAVACVSLIGFYVRYVLHSVKHAFFLATVLGAMYGAMLVILQSEDFTLVLGAVLVFMLIATMMFLTRHVNWYQLGQEKV